MPLVSLRDAEPPVSLVPRIIFLNLVALLNIPQKGHTDIQAVRKLNVRNKEIEIVLVYSRWRDNPISLYSQRELRLNPTNI